MHDRLKNFLYWSCSTFKDKSNLLRAVSRVYETDYAFFKLRSKVEKHSKSREGVIINPEWPLAIPIEKFLKL